MADNLVITLDALEPRATDMAQHLQASLDAATSLKAFTAEASKRAGETARLIGDHTLSVGKLFTGFDGLVEAQRDRLTARLGQASTQLVELKGMSLQHARELEQEHRDNETITRDLLDRLESFRQSLKSAGEAQRTVFAAGVLAVQVAQQGVFQAHAAVRAEFTSLSEGVTTAGRNLGTTLAAHSQGLQAASTICSRMTGDFATQTAGAGTSLDSRVQEVQDEQVRPVMALRAVQYTGALSQLQTGTTDAVDIVHTAVENHDSVGSAQADLLASGYENHKRHVLSTLPTTDQELADKVGFVKEVADYITKENPPPVEDTRNWFQKTWDWISHGVGEAASAVGHVVGTAWTNTSHWVVEHGNEILLGVGVVAVAVGAIILIFGTGGLATPAVVAGSSAAIAPMAGSLAGSAGAAAVGLHVGGALAATELSAVAAGIGVALAPEAAAAAVIAPALFSVGGFAVDATVGGVSLAATGAAAVGFAHAAGDAYHHVESRAKDVKDHIWNRDSDGLWQDTKATGGEVLNAAMAIKPGEVGMSLIVELSRAEAECESGTGQNLSLKNLIDPKMLQPPADYTTGKSAAQLDHALLLAKLGRVVYYDTENQAPQFPRQGNDGKSPTELPGYGQQKLPDGTGYVKKDVIFHVHDNLKVEVWETPPVPPDTLKGLAIVYRGSSTPWNWVENVAQGIGVEADLPGSIYQDAVKTAQDVQEKYKDEMGKTYSHIELTGHSLGGGLAQLASAATGIPAVTFNAAGVNTKTYEALQTSREAVKSTDYGVAGQILGQIQEGWHTGAIIPLGEKLLGPAALPLSLVASSSQVAGEKVVLGARRQDGEYLQMNSGQLHLWDAVEESLSYELRKAKEREAAAP